MTCLRVKPIRVSALLGQISYRQDAGLSTTTVVSARRRADERKSNSAFPMASSAPSAWLPRVNSLTFDGISIGLTVNHNHCEQTDREWTWR